MEVLLAGLLGLVLGSFCNVLIYRLPLDQNIAKPRSHCPQCKNTLGVLELIPVLSYILQRGRCKHCGTKIPLRYPLVELLCAGLLAASVEKAGGITMIMALRDWPLLITMVAVIFIDVDHRIIPDELTIGGALLAFGASFLDDSLGWELSLLGGTLGFAVFYSLAWAYEKASGRMGLGGGDIKIMALFGAWMGPQAVWIIILIGSVSGSVGGIALGLAQRDKNLLGKSIPFGPFLVIGALTNYFWDETLWHLFMTPM